MRKSLVCLHILPLLLAASAQAQDTTPTKEEVTVKGKRIFQGEFEYLPSTSDVGGKDNKSLKDTPQSVTVITKEVIDEQGAESLQDAVRYSAGVGAEQYGTDLRGDYIRVRGTNATLFKDGLAQLFNPNETQGRLNLWGAERVEVLKGPSSMIYGQGNIGGLVNYVTKIPHAEKYSEIRYEMGSYNRHVMSLDTMGALNDSKTFSYRLVSQIRDAETQVKHTSDDGVYFSPSIRWQPDADTSLVLLVNYQRDLGTPTSQFHPVTGSLRPLADGSKIPMRAYLGEPGFDEQRAETRSVSLFYDQEFNDTWSYHQKFRYSHHDTTYQQIYHAWGADVDANGNMARSTWVNKSKVDAFTTDAHGRAAFGGAIPTTVLVGADFQSSTMETSTGFASANPINVFTPVYGNYSTPLLTESPQYKVTQFGLYAQADAQLIESLNLIVGVRQDQSKTEGAAYQKSDSDATSSRAALVYKIIPELNAYFSYTESFTPNGGLKQGDKPLDPRKGQQYEVGTKFQNKSLLASLAYYQMVEKDRSATDPTDQNYSINVGEVEISGVEAEVNYDFTGSVSGLASYTYMDTEIKESLDPLANGARIEATPSRMANLWLNYRFLDEVLGGTKVGAGVRHIGESYDGQDNYNHVTPEVTLYDAVISYQKEAWQFILNGNNLADKTYITAARTFGDAFYGTRRTLSLTAGYKF